MSSKVSFSANSARAATGQEALEEASKTALEIYAITGSVYPAEWQGELVRLMTTRALYFAINARRVHEILRIRGDEIGVIKAALAPDAQEKLGFETGYWVSITKIIHARYEATNHWYQQKIVDK
ncbi:MAG TPA: hypothetical protein VEA41_05385 [Salinarimonas sp.]|nr:hypothetical protein [Salinarimonas sp.]